MTVRLAVLCDKRQSTVTSGVPLGPGTVWSEATGSKPGNPTIRSVAIDPAGNIYALLTTIPGGSLIYRKNKLKRIGF